MKKKLLLLSLVIMLCAMFSVTVCADELAVAAPVNAFIGTFW